ncbi:hypothetical protein JB92DRAFT_2999965 [Gautieria morchelliformis]|nr:hypothetical protein JB92DRAFT_2999965 [Gautieria morchelliformis]
MADTSLEAYLRVAAMAIALYDALWTIPAEISLYREQISLRRMTRACILFIILRYASILVIVVSNVGFFGEIFTVSACHKYYLVAPAFKGVQLTVSQIIMAIRTVAIARQTRWAVWAVSILWVITVTVEIFSTVWGRVPFQEPKGVQFANCIPGNVKSLKIAWVNYLAAILYDITCLCIATGFIIGQRRLQPKHKIDGLSKMLLQEGILYFIFITAVNLLNLVLYATGSEKVQTSGATLGYAFTWILSQRLLIHLQEFRTTIHPPEHPPSVNNYLPKPGFFMTSHTKADNRDDVELGVHVTIEENVKVDYDQDIAGGLVSQHRITAARIERQHRQREDRARTACEGTSVE